MNAYIAIDIETTGLDPDRHQVLEVAAVLNLMHLSVTDCPAKVWLIRPDADDIVGSPAALLMNRDLLEKLAEGGGVSPSTFMHDFLQTLNRWRYKYKVERFHPLGKNVGSFDIQFLRRIPDFPAWIFHHRCLDVGSMYSTPTGISGQADLIKQVEKDLDIEGEEHQALHDARVSLELARRKWRSDIFNEIYRGIERQKSIVARIDPHPLDKLFT